MNPWIKKSVIALCGATLITGAATAFGDQHPQRRGEGPHKCGAWMHDDAARAEHRAKRVERLSTDLGLNEEQKQKLAAFFDKLGEQRKAMMGDWKGRHEKIQTLLKGESFDRERAQVLLNEKVSALQSKGPELIGAAADLYDNLNADQQQKLREFLERRHGHRDHGSKVGSAG